MELQPTKRIANGSVPRCQGLKSDGHQCNNATRRLTGGKRDQFYCGTHVDGDSPRCIQRTMATAVSLIAYARIQKEAADQGISVSDWIRQFLPPWVR